MLKVFLAILALLALSASAQECSVTICPASTTCVEDPQDCATGGPCPQVKCAPINGAPDVCAQATCTNNQICLPDPKWCIHAPCSQYKCVSPEEFICATSTCPASSTCSYAPQQCFTPPCPQYNCVHQVTTSESGEPTCANAVCPQNSICLSEPKECFTTPCPQYACLPTTQCPDFCIEQYSPVCGSDKRTYSNICELTRAMCLTKTSLYVSSRGVCENDISNCPAFCTSDYQPVCGSDGNTYSNLCSLQLQACQTKSSISVAFDGACEDCNFACTLEYAPVCGSDGNTYANQCSLKSQSCKSKTPLSIQYAGECEVASDCAQFCPMDYSPVCGTDKNTYSNFCMLTVAACKTKSSISVAHQGQCSASEVGADVSSQQSNTAGIAVGVIIALAVGIALVVAGYMYLKKRNTTQVYTQFVNESL